MSNSNSENTPSGAEVKNLNRLEAIVRRGLDADVEVGYALAEISNASLYRGTHETFEAYLRDRWGIGRSRAYQLIQAAELADPASTGADMPAPATQALARAREALRCDGPEALADLWERAREEFVGDDVRAIDIRLTVRKRRQPAALKSEPSPSPRPPVELVVGELLRRLRWLLSESSGTIADVARHLETLAAGLDDDVRERLRDNVLVLDEELAGLKVLLAAPVDWDAEHERLLAGEIPPFEGDADDEEDE
jgi:hypothetical protein